jgi:hypothetical protein
MKHLLTEWRKFLTEGVSNTPESREHLAKVIAQGLPEDQKPGFVRSEMRKFKLDDEYFQKQYDAYAEEIGEYKE